MKSDSIAQSDVETDMTVKIARDDNTAQDLRAAAGSVKDGKVARRLLAIALVLEGASRKTASKNCGMDRQTLRDRCPAGHVYMPERRGTPLQRRRH